MGSILLVTTGANRLTEIISASNYPSTIIDCNAFKNRTEFLRSLYAIEQFDIMVTFRCPYLIPPEIYKRAIITAVNIHPTLLPDYPGANPWQQMTAADETNGGVTLHHITDQADCGEIIIQKRFEMDLSRGYNDARIKSEELATEILSSYLKDILHNNQ